MQVCQLTELKQSKEWERNPNRSRRLCEALLPENLEKHCREWPAGKTESVIKLVHRWLSPESGQGGVSLSSKARLPSMNTVQLIIIVSTSSLTMEVEAVAHALHWIAPRGDSQITHADILTDSMCSLQKGKGGIGSPGWHVSIFDIHLRKPMWMYCPGHAGVKGNDQADRLAGNQPSEDVTC